LREISAVTFEYFGYDPLEKVHKWFEEWDSVAYEGKLPSAIKIKLEYFDEGKKRQLVRVVPIPAGG
jgi:hypothetical protein